MLVVDNNNQEVLVINENEALRQLLNLDVDLGLDILQIFFR